MSGGETLEELRAKLLALQKTQQEEAAKAQIQQEIMRAQGALKIHEFDARHKLIGGGFRLFNTLGKKAYDYATSPLTPAEIAQLPPAQRKAYMAALKKGRVKA